MFPKGTAEKEKTKVDGETNKGEIAWERTKPFFVHGKKRRKSIGIVDEVFCHSSRREEELLEGEEEERKEEVEKWGGGKKGGEEGGEDSKEEENDKEIEVDAIFGGVLLVVGRREGKKTKKTQNKEREGIEEEVVEGLLFGGFFLVFGIIVGCNCRITATKKKTPFKNIRTHPQIHQSKAKCFSFHKISRVDMKIDGQNGQNGNHYNSYVGPG